MTTTVLDQLLELQERLDESFRARRASGNVDVDRHDSIDALDCRVAPLVAPTRAGAVTQGDAPLRLRHLLPESDERAGHLCRARAATMRTSAWRGLARNGNHPKRSMSFLLVAAEIISIAQQARPDSSGHRLLTRMRSRMTSALAGMTSSGPDHWASSRRPRPLASNSARWVISLGKPPLYATGSATVQRLFGTTIGSAAGSRLAWLFTAPPSLPTRPRLGGSADRRAPLPNRAAG
jgi:hypothetical protein